MSQNVRRKIQFYCFIHRLPSTLIKSFRGKHSSGWWLCISPAFEFSVCMNQFIPVTAGILVNNSSMWIRRVDFLNHFLSHICNGFSIIVINEINRGRSYTVNRIRHNRIIKNQRAILTSSEDHVNTKMGGQLTDSRNLMNSSPSTIVVPHFNAF